MALDQHPQQLGSGFGGIGIHGDDLAPLAPARDLELGVAHADDATQPPQLLLRLEALDVEVGAEPAMVDWHSGLERERLNRRKVDDQDLRVVEVAAGQLPKLDRALRFGLELAHQVAVERDPGSIWGHQVEGAVEQACPIRHQRRMLLDVEPLAVAMRRVVDERPAAITLQPLVGDKARLEPFTRHRLDRVPPYLSHHRHLARKRTGPLATSRPAMAEGSTSG